MDTTIPDFAFVDAEELRMVLEDYRDQTQRALDAECHLGAIVGCGSLIEGLLTWALLRRGRRSPPTRPARTSRGTSGHWENGL